MTQLFVLVTGIFLAYNFSFSIDASNYHQGKQEAVQKYIERSMFFIGTTPGGKSYYADKTPMNWTDAKAHCHRMRMQIACVSSKDSFDLLNAVNISEFYDNTYWSAGRDKRTLDQFNWDHLPYGPNPSYFKIAGYRSPILTCLELGKRKESLGGQLVLYVNDCAKTRYVLCETIRNTNF